MVIFSSYNIIIINSIKMVIKCFNIYYMMFSGKYVLFMNLIDCEKKCNYTLFTLFVYLI